MSSQRLSITNPLCVAHFSQISAYLDLAGSSLGEDVSSPRSASATVSSHIRRGGWGGVATNGDEPGAGAPLTLIVGVGGTGPWGGGEVRFVLGPPL